MFKRIVVLYLCIVATLLVASLTIKTGENKMGWNPANWSIVNTLQGQNNTAPATNAPSNGVDNVKIGGLTPGGAQGLEPPRMSGAEQQAIYDYYDPGLQGGGSYDPAAAAAASAQPAATQGARNSFNSGRTNIYDSARGAVQGTIGSQRNNILDFVDSLRNSQQGIDQGRIKAQLGKDRATTGIMGMVGRGIQSGATMLANRNAGDSSASGAIAKAYGDLGNRQQSDVNNQFGMQQEDFNISQGQLGQQRASGLRKFGTDRENTVNSVVENARQSFAALNEQAAGAGIEDRIAIEQEKEAIRNQTLQQLAVLDQDLAGVNSVQAMGGDTIRSEAGRLNKLGQGEGSKFSFTDQAPAQFQQGASIGQLPIYSNRRRQA